MYLAYLPLPFYIASSLEPLCPKFVLVFDAGLMVHGVSVSMTFISNNASTWGVQTPRMPRSALNPGPSALDSLLVHVQPDSILEQPYPQDSPELRYVDG